MRKPVVLIFAAYYLPGYKAGGPIRTLVNMTDRLGDEFDFYLVTRDRDLGDSKSYGGVETDSWISVRNARVRYLRPDQVSFAQIASLIRQVAPDVIYLNSFFNPHFTQRILWLRFLRKLPVVSIVLAPRGEFSSGALGIKSFKKRIYIAFSKWLGVYSSVIWQASSAAERRDINQVFSHIEASEIVTAMNLAPLPRSEVSSVRPKTQGEPVKVCFLSRISQMKNLDYALNVLEAINTPVTFTIYGPLSDMDYWKECKRIIDRLPKHVRVSWEGEVQPVNIQQTLAEHDLFFLPTRGENYGHAIHEALSSGLPVLISDQTPWSWVQKQGVGWALSLSEPRAFTEVIELVASWGDVKRESVFADARQYACEVANDISVLEANRQLFLERLKE